MSLLTLTDKFNEIAFEDGVFTPKKVGRMRADILTLDIPGFRTYKEKVCALFLNLRERPKCVCGNETELITTVQGFRPFCSRKCAAINEETKKARAKTCLERFGVENVGAADLIKDKIKNTNLEKYGHYSSFGALEIRDKIKNANLEKYGVENAMQSESAKKNLSKTFSLKTPEEKHFIKAKRQSTVKEKFGYDFVLQDPNIRQQITQTNLKKYGHHIPIHGSLKEKYLNARLETYKTTILPVRLEQCAERNIIPVGWGVDDYLGGHLDYKFLHVECGTEFAGQFLSGGGPICPNCKPNRSVIEMKFYNALLEFFPNAVSNSRDIIKPLEIDILIGDVGVEVNGVYWHRDDFNKPLSYKTELFPGTLLHFWDFELEDKFDICLSMTRAKLKSFNERIFARRCELRKISSIESRAFFEENHLQGNAKSAERYALFYQGKLIQCISIGKSRFNKKADLELIRFATAKNIQVVGGFSKLLSAVKRAHGGKILLTYADKRHSTANTYKQFFDEVGISKPNYLWVKNSIRLSRYQTQRHKLLKMFDDVTPSDTEASIMQRHKFYKISDCGNIVLQMIL